MIRSANIQDAQSICNIYNYYIENTVVTFEEDFIHAKDIAARLEETRSADLPWLVVEKNREVLGYAYASKWKGRCAYRHSVEVTIYLHQNAKGKGLGSHLYTALFEQLKQRGIHVAIGGISLPNEASIALHEKLGMEKVAHFKEVGYKFDRWVDVGYWQKIIQAN